MATAHIIYVMFQAWWYHLHNILNRSGCRLYNMNSDKMVTHSSFILLCLNGMGRGRAMGNGCQLMVLYA